MDSSPAGVGQGERSATKGSAGYQVGAICERRDGSTTPRPNREGGTLTPQRHGLYHFPSHPKSAWGLLSRGVCAMLGLEVFWVRTWIKVVVALAAGAMGAWLLVSVADADFSLLLDLDLRWELYAASVPLYLGVTVARGARLRVLLGPGHSVPLLSAVSALHSLAIQILPFRTGEAALPVLLRRHEVAGLARGSVTLVSVRLMDFIVVLAAVGVSAAVTHAKYLGAWWPWLAAGFLACLLSLLGLLFFLLARRPHGFSNPASGHVTRGFESALVLNPASTLIRSSDYEAEVGHRGSTVPDSRRSTNPFVVRGSVAKALRAAGLGLAASLVAWACLFGCYHLFMKWAGVAGLSFAQSVLAAAGGVAAGFLPTNTLLSLGTLEAGWTAGLYLVGIDPAEGAVVGFRLHAAILLVNLIYAGLGLIVMRFLPRSAGHPKQPCTPTPLP